MNATQSELRLARLIDERELVRGKHESKLGEIEARDDNTLTTSDSEQLTAYRERAAELDTEIGALAGEIKAANDAIEQSRQIRRTLAGSNGGVEMDADGVVYRDFYSYARDVVLSKTSLGDKWSNGEEQAIMRERLQLMKRVPANTLSSNVGGLQPPQHIAQIFQVINNSRPLVDSALRSTIERGTLTYPKVSQRPVVAVQQTEKTEAGNQGMIIDMETTTASTYLGGGDLSWQALNWSTPDALQLWFDLAAADYALKTEQDASQALQHSAFTYDIGSPIGSTPTFSQLLTALAAGAAAVYANSGRMADTIYMAVDRYWYFFGLTSDQFPQVATVNADGFGPLTVIPCRGMDSGVIVVGDNDGLLVAETAGAPVELKVVEPAIGGVEVGLIGAFEAVVVDDGAFSMITTAS